MKSKSEIYAEAIEKWGQDAQMLMAVEEMSELQKAILKYLRWGNRGQVYRDECVDAIAEEIADVEITIERLQQMVSCSDKVENYKTQKLARLERRLGE